MPATRLLLIADSKMLPALANGLREGGLFDVLTVPLSEPAAALAAAERADAVALFYGAPGAPLPAALQTLSPKVRDRGARMVVVLQREQAAQRDDCFRAGASDLLFMPMPKDQFLARLRGSFELAWPQEAGSPVPVSVATRTATSRLEQARVSPAGVEAPSELPLKAGETVRLSWGNFQSWGLVVRGAPSLQVRFAGLAPEEEVQVRDWLKGGAGTQDAAAKLPTPIANAPVRSAAAPPSSLPTPPGGAAAVPSTPPPGGRSAPAIGPPPGFADRKPVRAQARAPVRVAPPMMTAAGATAALPAADAPPSLPTASAAPALATPPSTPVLAPPAPPSTPVAAALEAAAPFSFLDPPAPAIAPAAAPAGPTWPVPFAAGQCKAIAMQFLKDKAAPADTPPGLAASAKKITSMLGSAERAALDKAPDSHFADALAARIALDAATSEGVRLYASSPALAVDAAGIAVLLKQADEAAARLQKEANTAVGKGEVELLQMVTAASAALSRDLLTFRETSDRLRGQSAAPRLGAGALDPDVVLPGQGGRPAAPKTSTPAAVRAELRDFQNLDSGPGRGKTVLMVLALGAFILALANAVYFGVPRHKELTPESAGKGVERIDVSGEAALVTVSQEWLAAADANLPALASALREAEVKKAVLTLANGRPAGVLDVPSGKVSGLARPKAGPPPH